MATVQRPDGLYSWVIAVACFWVTFVTQGLVRCGGVVYVYVIEIYKVGRGPASWPFILRLAIWNLSGPLAGALSYRWSIRTITFFGVLVVAAGNALCWFASDISAVTVFLGVLQGLGLGMVMTLVPVIINQYFVKYKATGAGIACAGGTAGSFALPPVVEVTVEEYGLQGAFLMMGGITLQGVLGAALMRPAPWLKKTTTCKEPTTVVTVSDSDTAKRNGTTCTKPNGTAIKPSLEDYKEGSFSVHGKCVQSPQSSAHCYPEKRLAFAANGCQEKPSKVVRFSGTVDHLPHQKNPQNENAAEENADETSNLLGTSECPVQFRPTRQEEADSPDQLKTYDVNLYPSNSEIKGILRFLDDEDSAHDSPTDSPSEIPQEVHPSQESCNLLQPLNDNLPTTTAGNGKTMSSKSGGMPAFLEPLKNAWTIIRNVMFLVTAINYSMFFLSYMTYLIVIVDYAFDLGVDKTSSVFLVSAFSIADLCGRLGSGWITDSGLVKRRNLVVCNMLMLGILFIGTSFAKTYIAVVSVSVAAGLVVGMNLILFYALLEEYLGLQHMAMAVGLMNFMIGWISLISPTLTGFFRDTLGSYDHLFHFLGSCLLFCGLLWIIDPLYASRKKKIDQNSKLEVNLVVMNKG